ncbi:MAG: energy transducer TonB [Saprospiraceae bacterium]
MTATVKEEENRTKGVIVSLIFHAGLVLMMLMYTFTKKPEAVDVPPITIDWGGGGDNAAAGLPDQGQGSNPAPKGQQMEDPSSTEPVSEPVPSPTKASPPPAASKPAASPPAQTTPTSEDPNVAALKRAKEETRRKQDEANRQQQAQQEANRQAEAQRQATAAAAAAEKQRQQDEINKKKGQFGGAFGNGNGSGQGNTGKPGNQGIPTGTGTNPNGTSNGDGGGTGGGSGTGTGVSVGGGLGGRAIANRGPVNDNSQKSGTVVIKICVDGSGNVISADYTQAGSTTTDAELRNKALASARQYRFKPGGSGGTDCGTLTYNFRLK